MDFDYELDELQYGETTTVPLGPNGDRGTVVLRKDDYDLLLELGLSECWNALRINDRIYVTAPSSRAPGSRVLVARVLMDAKRGERVIFLDGNPLNMRRENLRLVKGHGKRRDRDFVGRLARRQASISCL